MNRMQGLLLMLITVAMCSHLNVHAAHIIGGELYYDHLGGDQYEVTLTLYRECYGTGADFDSEARLTVFTGSGVYYTQYNVPYTGRIPLPVTLDTPCLTLPPDICMEMTSYTTIMTLEPSSEGYQISFQRCCRQPNASNILNPSSIGLTVTVIVPPEPNSANSSARFNDLPPVALCLNEPLFFDHSATDPDGDSLVYSLITPYVGAGQGNPYPLQSAPPPYDPLQWSPGYSEGFQMDSSPPLSIDPVTGLLTVHPNLVANYVIGVSVKEYREGVLLTEAIRDFLFSVVPCNATVSAAVEPQTQFCAGELTIPFVNNSIGGQEISWDFGVPGTVADTSNQFSPIWTYDEYGTYTITLIVNPGAVCADTAIVTYALYPTPSPSFVVPDPTCGILETVLTAEGMTQPNSTVAWYLGWGTPSFATTDEVEVSFPMLGDQPVTLTITEFGCTGFFDATVTAQPQPEAYLYADPASPQPDGANVLFTDGSNANDGNIVSSVWTFDGNVVDGSSGSFPWENATPGTHEITLTITTDAGCTDTYTMIYVIIPEEIQIPNVFTPNGDGLNDRLVIENVQYYQNELSIFNRWGDRIYSITDYQNQWTGNGVPEGTYYYELKLSDGRDFTGHLTILR